MGGVRRKGVGDLVYKRGGERMRWHNSWNTVKTRRSKREEWVKYDGSEICGDESIICRLLLNTKTAFPPPNTFLFQIPSKS